MRPSLPLPLALLLACGPLTPPFDAASTTDETTTTTPATTGPPPSPTTASPTTTTNDTTTPATTGLPPSPTTASPTTTTNDTTTNPETTAHQFIVTPDGGTAVNECDLFDQDCDPGQKCVPWANNGGDAWNALKCVDITGDGAPGEPCLAPEGPAAGIDDCALGAICWNVDETNHGICIALCTGSPDAPQCPEKSSCAIAGDGVLVICIPDCDPLLQDCSNDNLCIPSNDTFTCVLDASGEQGQFNDPCEFANVCDKGLVCLNTAAASAACDPESQGCCQPFCQFPGAPCPNPDQQCLQWYDPRLPIPEGSENLGICSIPE